MLKNNKINVSMYWYGVLVVFALLYGFYLFLVAAWYADIEETNDALHFQLSKLANVNDNRDLVFDALRKEEDFLDAVVFVSEENAATRMQQQFRQMLSELALETQGSQILPVEEMDGFDIVKLQVRLGLSMRQLVDLLSLLNDSRPYIFVDKLLLQPSFSRGGSDAQTLNVQLYLGALRVRL